jgi:hypothetical protein
LTSGQSCCRRSVFWIRVDHVLTIQDQKKGNRSFPIGKISPLKSTPTHLLLVDFMKPCFSFLQRQEEMKTLLHIGQKDHPCLVTSVVCTFDLTCL